ncbi:short-chain dehydrogenase [Pelomyxa schiedti]|nr:short-chain dehydrogenase [Pelomyxa schiedti]
MALIHCIGALVLLPLVTLVSLVTALWRGCTAATRRLLGRKTSATATTPIVVAITGASTGIGHGLALHYASQSAARKVTLLLIARNTEKLKDIATRCEEMGAVVFTAALDVARRKELHNYLQDFDSRFPIDIVFANAGVSAAQVTSTGVQNDEDVWQRIFHTNVNGVLNTVMPLIDRMKCRKNGAGGHIVLISSLSGFALGGGSYAPYSTSKAALTCIGKGLQLQMRNTPVKVVVVCPGFVVSAMTDAIPETPMPQKLTTKEAVNQIIAAVGDPHCATRLHLFPWPFALLSLFGLIPYEEYFTLYSLLKTFRKKLA